VKAVRQAKKVRKDLAHLGDDRRPDGIIGRAYFMGDQSIFKELAVKGADVGLLADRLISDSEQIPQLVDAVQTEKSARKFAYEKILRFVSAKRPDLIYPYFDVFSSLLDSENNFLKWGAIMTVSNLTNADTDSRFEAIFRKYFDPIGGPAMITAANIIGSSVTISNGKPALVNAIAEEILKVEKAKYKQEGRLSPECRNIAIGHAIDSLDKLYDRIENKAAVAAFVKRQLKNTRKPVAKRAERFIRRHVTP
jgi:hypothetical protein